MAAAFVAEPPQSDFLPQEEALNTAALDGHGEFEIIANKPKGRQVTTPASIPYNRPPKSDNRGYQPPPIDNATKLPGAFFFLYLIVKDGSNPDKKLRIVAYDPWVQLNTSRKSILEYYYNSANNEFKLPYYEVFDAAATGPWVSGDTNYYSGTFGGDDTKSGDLSLNWYYPNTEAKTPITKGVNIAFWNQLAESNRGLFTSSPNQSFDKSAAANIMRLFPGSGTNFVTNHRKVKWLELDFYAVSNGTGLPE